ncbi:MAG: tetratricopeptide repeat protein [wastewater metagenome]|nr:tetratricopeptide repeat protein [Candidatus Loosdrechtia aerotolerans]
MRLKIKYFIFFILLYSIATAGNAFAGEPRIVKVKAVGDKQFRKQEDWRRTIEEGIRRVSAFFEKQFDISFVLKEIGEWDAAESKDIQSLLKDLEKKTGKGNNDIVIGFSSQLPSRVSCIFRGLPLGVALPFHDYLVVRADKNAHHTKNDRMVRILAHELAHVFGAFHVNDSSSIMNISLQDKEEMKFDAGNKQIIALSGSLDFHKGVTSIDRANLDRILGIYRDSLQDNLEITERHKVLGTIYDELGSFEMAIDEYKKAVASDPKDLESSVRLGIAYVKQGLLDHAVEALSRAARFDTSEGVAHFNLGLVLMKKGLLDEAISQVKKSIKINRSNPEARCVLGGLYIQKGLYNKAIKECREALKISDTYADAHYNLGLAYHAKSMLDHAIHEYKKVLSIDSSNRAARINLGTAYYDQGLLDEAITEYQKILEADPDDEMARNNLKAVFLAKEAD